MKDLIIKARIENLEPGDEYVGSYTAGYVEAKKDCLRIINNPVFLDDEEYWKIENSIFINGRYVILVCAEDDTEGTKWGVCEVKMNCIAPKTLFSVVCESYLEAINVWTERINTAVQSVSEETKDFRDSTVLTKQHCTGTIGDYTNMVCVLDFKSLVPESRISQYQLVFVTAGNGTRPYSRGSACYCQYVYSMGKQERWECFDILGVVDILGVAVYEALPEWAKTKIDELQKEYRQPICFYKEKQIPSMELEYADYSCVQDVQFNEVVTYKVNIDNTPTDCVVDVDGLLVGQKIFPCSSGDNYRLSDSEKAYIMNFIQSMRKKEEQK